MTKRSFALVKPANPGDATFPHQLPIELAMGLNTPKEICEAYGLDRNALVDLWDVPQFKAIYEWALEIKTEPNGVFRLQMVMMSDDIARTIYLAMTDTEGGMGQRLNAAKLAAELGGLAPPKAKDGPASTERFAININFAPRPAEAVSEQRPAIEVIPLHG